MTLEIGSVLCAKTLSDTIFSLVMCSLAQMPGGLVIGMG
jgi:hypothetical protein